MFKKFKKKPKSVSMTEVTARVREFVMDSQINHAHEISVLLGCSAISDDVQRREEDESDNRVEKLSPVIPLLYAYAHMLAEGAVEYQRAEAQNLSKTLSEEVWVESRKMMEQIAFATTVGALSQLIDMDFIAFKKKSKWAKK